MTTISITKSSLHAILQACELVCYDEEVYKVRATAPQEIKDLYRINKHCIIEVTCDFNTFEALMTKHGIKPPQEYGSYEEFYKSGQTPTYFDKNGHEICMVYGCDYDAKYELTPEFKKKFSKHADKLRQLAFDEKRNKNRRRQR
jgi:hypothetical protein